MTTPILTKYLKDYIAPNYLVNNIDICFTVDEVKTSVLVSACTYYYKNTMTELINNNVHATNQLTLDGSAKLISIKLDDKEFGDYQLSNAQLTLNNLPDKFKLEIITELLPWQDKSCMGLYASAGNLITQCEPEGFRKITYYQDHPDVMASFTTTIIANHNVFPVMLSNGNLITQQKINQQQTKVVWHDPFKKPSYLFALVVANLDKLQDSFVTQSGREVLLEIYSESDNIERCKYAMEALKRSMIWEEKRFGLEYDLDRFMIVATNDFNMGAMENKGLNVFNTKYLLADQHTATDTDFIRIEAVIGHEYFHNWSGNRVTCRDWFQLSLKEGFTVFRDQEFTSDLHDRTVNRIDQVKALRSRQFPEDKSPLAHPVRPESFVEINNFYTMTIYEKGAEIVRMYHTILGEERFQNGVKLYFKRHDGKAVTVEDFYQAMVNANPDIDFAQFMLWYSQAGTPQVKVISSYNQAQRQYILEFTQHIPDTFNQTGKQPMLIPISIGLLDKNGHDILGAEISGGRYISHSDGNNIILLLDNNKNVFMFDKVNVEPIPSLLREFSAPVNLEFSYSNQQRLIIAKHDSDQFNRFESLQHLFGNLIINYYQQLLNLKNSTSNVDDIIDDQFIQLLKSIATDGSLNSDFKALLLKSPSFEDLLLKIDNVHPAALYQAIQTINTQIGNSLFDLWMEIYNNNLTAKYKFEDHDKRALKNLALNYIICGLSAKTSNLHSRQLIETLTLGQLHNADNMTDSIAVLVAINNLDIPVREQILKEFYDKWNQTPLIMDKWFAIQAISSLINIEALNKLIVDQAFDATNPNKIYSLLRTFTLNGLKFHSESGYEFVVDQIIAIDKFNPQVASVLAQGFNSITSLNPKHKSMAKNALQRIIKQNSMSKNVLEIVNKLISGI